MKRQKQTGSISVRMVILSMVLVAAASAQECVVTMGYKASKATPFLFGKDQGIYHDVYAEALRRIGCTLRIVRLPKCRVIRRLKEGSVDFYPSLSPTRERRGYLHFLPGQIPLSYVVVTRDEIPPLESLRDLMEYHPVLLKELKNHTPLEALPGRRFEQSDVRMENALKLLKNRHIDAFAMPERVVEYYLRHHPAVDGIRIHRGLFPPEKENTLGFSRFSPYFHEEINPDYNPAEPLSEENPLTVMDPDCIAARFSSALEGMRQDGTIARILARYK